MGVTIHTHLPVDTEGATVVAAFPSIGLVSTIAATHLVEELDLQQVGVMDSPAFPTISVVENGEPLNPVRIYAGHAGANPLVVFLSEFQPSPDLVRPVSEALLTWCRDNHCGTIITPEGLLVDDDAEEEPQHIYAAASTLAARERIAMAGTHLLPEGLVAGVTGVLLNLGKRDQFPVVAMLAEAQQGRPDGRSASRVVSAIAAYMGTEIAVDRLHHETEAFEEHVDDMQRRLRLQEGETPASAGMYG